MIRLYLDTSYKHLNIGLQKDGQWLEKISMEAFKKQSEVTMPMIEDLFKRHNIKPRELNEVILTKGPGSYTGIRIAMTIAKVLGAIANVTVYTLDTLRAMSPLSSTPTLSIIDARSQRAYIAMYQDNQIMIAPQVINIEDIKLDKGLVVGDGHLIDQESMTIDLLENMKQLENSWEKVEDIHNLVPLYLKDQNSYGKD